MADVLHAVATQVGAYVLVVIALQVMAGSGFVEEGAPPHRSWLDVQRNKRWRGRWVRPPRGWALPPSTLMKSLS